MSYIFEITILALTFLASLVLSKLFINFARAYSLLDIPNQRSSHSIPTPRGGGVVFALIWLLLASFSLIAKVGLTQIILATLPSALILTALGFLDDRWGVHAKWRLLVQFIAAILAIVILGGFTQLNIGFMTLNLGLIGSLLAVLGLVWSINLYNFMDGTDGIASVAALFIFGMGSFFLWHVGGYHVAFLLWTLLASVLGFLVWNFPPAKLFMGDAGSNFLGFLVLIFALLSEKIYGVPALLWVILYSLFWVDTTITLIRRFFHKEKVYEAHRAHAYQRLQVITGSHRQVLLYVTLINILLSGLAILGYFYRHYLLLFLVIAVIIATIFYLVVEKIAPMYPRQN